METRVWRHATTVLSAKSPVSLGQEDPWGPEAQNETVPAPVRNQTQVPWSPNSLRSRLDRLSRCSCQTPTAALLWQVST